MKKVFSKIIVAIVSIIMCLSILVGCDWIQVDQDKDMAQVIASVQISDEVDSEDIYKRELVSGFLSYGFQYVYYYGYTSSQAYDVVLKDLVKNRIIVQQSRVELAKTYNSIRVKNDADLTDFEKYFKANATAGAQDISAKSGDIESLKKYLTEYEIEYCYYQARKTVNDSIEAYVEEEEEDDEKEDVTYDERVAPTKEDQDTSTEDLLKTATPTANDYDIANVVLKLEGDAIKNQYDNLYDLNMAIYKNYKIEIPNDKKKAYSSLIQYLRESGLINSEESYDYTTDTDNVLKYTYFEDILTTQLENVLVSKYEDSLIAGVQDKLDNDALWKQYQLDYASQEALYRNDYSAYESALDSASDTSLVLYNPFGGYGYVTNLLLGFSDVQTAKLSEFEAKKGITQAEIDAYRQTLLSQIVASDQRSSWAFLNYGSYDKDNKTFIFEDEFVVLENSSFKSFLGTITVKDEEGKIEEDENGVEKTKWEVIDAVADDIALSDFVQTYLVPLGINELYFDNDDAQNTVGTIAGYNDEIFDKLLDLTFVFSTDPGSLQKTYGYLYSPFTSANQYVTEFAQAAKVLVEKGVGSYAIVGTDYGYHVMVCSKVVETSYDPATDKDAFVADLEDKDSLAYKFKKVKLDSVTENEVSKIANQFINTYLEDETKVEYFNSTYKDLITEEVSSEE